MAHCDHWSIRKIVFHNWENVYFHFQKKCSLRALKLLNGCFRVPRLLIALCLTNHFHPIFYLALQKFCISWTWMLELVAESLTQEWPNEFSTSWESSICERKVTQPWELNPGPTPIRGELATLVVSVGLKKTCGHSPLYPSKVGPPWLPTIRLRADTILNP